VRLGLVSLAAAVAVTDVVGDRWRIKWPNDVVAEDGRKLAGILAEAEWDGGRPAFVVVGIGVNVHAAPPDLPAVALADVGPAPDRVALARALVDAVVRRVGDAEVLATWRARSATLGRRVTVGAVTGVAVDVADDGALRVIAEDGTEHLVRAGDLVVHHGGKA
jgi:BirA family biotin operon repressor/biotin-[acetyl-CoA-carboxylase] ligase